MFIQFCVHVAQRYVQLLTSEQLSKIMYVLKLILYTKGTKT